MSVFFANISNIISALSSHNIPEPPNLHDIPPSSARDNLTWYRYGDSSKRSCGAKPCSIAYYEGTDGSLVVFAQDFRTMSSGKEILYVPAKRREPLRRSSSLPKQKHTPKTQINSVVEDSTHEQPTEPEKKHTSSFGESKKSTKEDKLQQIKHQLSKAIGHTPHSYLTSKGFGLDTAAKWGMVVYVDDVKCNLIMPLSNATKTIDLNDKKERESVTSISYVYKGEDGNHLKGNLGSANGKWFIHGDLNTDSVIIICEGVATGIAIKQAIQLFSPSTVCMICTQGTTTECQAEALKRVLYDRVNKQSKVVICADNDWANESCNAGKKSGEMLADMLDDAILILAPTENLTMPTGKPATDFQDYIVLRQSPLDKDQGKREVYNLIGDAIQESQQLDLATGVYATDTPYERINKYHASNAYPKLDCTFFPPAFLELINIEGRDVYDKNFATYVLCKLSHDIGIVGSQMYTVNGTIRRYATFSVLVVAGTTSGKSHAKNCAAHLASLCKEEINDYVSELSALISNEKKKLNQLDIKIKKPSNKKKVSLFEDEDAIFEQIVESKEKIDIYENAIKCALECVPLSDNITQQKIHWKFRYCRTFCLSVHEYLTLNDSLANRKATKGVSTDLISVMGGQDTSCETKGDGNSSFASNSGVSICACSTANSLSKCFGLDDIGSGFAARFFFSYIPHKNKDYGAFVAPIDNEHENLKYESERCDAFDRVRSLWRNIFYQRAKEFLITGQHKDYRKGVFFSKKDSLVYRDILTEFVRRLGSSITNNDFGAGEDGNAAIVSRSQEAFHILASYFTMLEIDRSEFDSKFLINLDELVKETKQAYETNKFYEKKIPLPLDPPEPTVIMRENSARAAASVLTYCAMCAREVYPQFISGRKITHMDLPTPAQVVCNGFVLDIVKRRYAGKKPKLSNYKYIKHLVPKKFMIGNMVQTAFESLLEDGKIEVVKGAGYKGSDAYRPV